MIKKTAEDACLNIVDPRSLLITIVIKKYILGSLASFGKAYACFCISFRIFSDKSC